MVTLLTCRQARRAAVVATLCWALPAAARDRPMIAFTFDDVPVHGRLPPGETRATVVTSIARTLRRARVPATGFLNAGNGEREPGAALATKAWRDAGFALGNHGWSHANLDSVGTAAFEEDIARNEPALEALMGARDWKWFRYPFLAEGGEPNRREAIRAYLAGRGYRVAGVTMSFGDFLFTDPYARCAATGDDAAISRMERSFLAAAADSAAATRAEAKRRYGRDIPYVLLMHVGAFDARMLPRLIAAYRRAGFRFVSLEEAARDPAFKAYADPSNPGAPPPLALPRTTTDLSWLATACSGARS